MYLSITYFYECLFCNLCEITIKLYDNDLEKLLFVLKIMKIQILLHNLLLILKNITIFAL